MLSVHGQILSTYNLKANYEENVLSTTLEGATKEKMISTIRVFLLND